VLAEGALVYPRSKLLSGHVYAGRPAEIVRALEVGELEERAAQLRRRDQEGPPLREPWSGQREHRGALGHRSFLAATARVRGEIQLAAATSIWFGCDIDVGSYGLVVGESSNIQDNTIVRCREGPLTMGAHSVIGHNVKLGGCTIGDGSLVGIGSVIAEGTIIDDGVLVAAGTQTDPGQRLEGGWLWGGNPARPISRMNEARREMIAATIVTYMGYAEAFSRGQRTRGIR
jgi:gamma-carbonic anhydrase